MSLIDRHKKPGGFKKLVNSLETTAPDKRKKIMDAMRAESFEFINDVEECLFAFDEFEKLEDMVMCEFIYTQTEFKTLALALHKHANQALVEKFKKNMNHKQLVQIKEQESLLNQITTGEQMAAQFKLIGKARELEKLGKMMIKKYNPKYKDE